MSILDTFQKNFDTLTGQFTEYKDYHDTMVSTIPTILELLDSLFLEENVKALNNYKLLKEDYLDAIKAILDPDNYKDVKFEAELPDIYDAPRTRREKAKKITKLKAKKVTTLPARIQLQNNGNNNSINGSEKGAERGLERGVGTDRGLDKGLERGVEKGAEKKVDKALQSYAQEGKRVYNYNSPLDCERPNKIQSGPPDRVLIELPDESKAYLYNDGRILDHKQVREIGKIEPNGVIILNNSELGKIHVVNRDETKFVTLTNNFGRSSNM